MFVVLLKYKVEIEKVLAERPAHVLFLDKFYEKGVFIMSGRKYDQKGGVIIVNLSSSEEVSEIMKQDPFYINGIADFEIIGFDVTKSCSELSNIIK